MIKKGIKMKVEQYKKLQELLYDIHRQKDADHIHNLIIKYLEDKQIKDIIVKSMNIDYTDRAVSPMVQLTFILPPEFLKHDIWTIENILK